MNRENDQISAEVDCVWQADAVLGEGPLWHPPEQCLYWLDIKGRHLHRYRHEGKEKRSWRLPLRIGSIAVPPPAWPRPAITCDMTFLAGTEHGFAWLILSGDSAWVSPIRDPEEHLPGNRFNDGKLGPDGRFYAGSLDDSEQEERGSLYALDRDFRVTRVDSGYKVTNGPAFAADGRTVYHTDSARRTIYRFMLSSTDGQLTDKQVFRQFKDGEGYPDGMTTDRVGNLYVAMWDGWRIEKLSPNGETLGVITMPVARPTSCIFAGEDERVLFATSASIGTETGQQPLAGGLFRIELRQ